MQEHPGDARTRGFLALFTAFSIWGLLPIYLRALKAVAPLQIMAYRLVFCCVVALLWLAARRELAQVRRALSDPSTRVRLVASALLISLNWFTYVWAVANGRVVEASLGYFINPLVNVCLGVLLLGERLRRAQWIAVALAAAGVAYVTWLRGALPIIALVLAGSFGTYGLLRKTVAAPAMVGLAAETSLIAPLGAAYLIACELTGSGALGQARSIATGLLLVSSGVITAVPLWLFAYGARRVSYASVGLMQYLSPTLQLALGLALFHEPFDAGRMVGFGLIWCGLAVYSADAVHSLRRVR